MSNGLALTRTPSEDRNELLFYVQDSNGQTIPIKQTIEKVRGKQVRIYIEAPENVKIFRGELLCS